MIVQQPEEAVKGTFSRALPEFTLYTPIRRAHVRACTSRTAGLACDIASPLDVTHIQHRCRVLSRGDHDDALLPPEPPHFTALTLPHS